MGKIEKFILHVPIIGLTMMLTIMGSRTRTEKEVTLEEVKIPLIIQTTSILLLVLLSLIFN